MSQTGPMLSNTIHVRITSGPNSGQSINLKPKESHQINQLVLFGNYSKWVTGGQWVTKIVETSSVKIRDFRNKVRGRGGAPRT